MTHNKKLSTLAQLIADLKEQESLELSLQMISEGTDPIRIIESSHQGMVEVGFRYEKGIYFISALVMAGEIMQQITRLVLPLTLDNPLRKSVGTVVIGTVEGDIHHIGKEIFKTFLQGHGFFVHDLGVDVPRHKFLSAIHEFKPDIVGISCLISTCIDSLAKTISHLKANTPDGLKPMAYLAGGRLMTPLVCKTVGADLCTTDSMEGVRLCQKIMQR